MTLTRLRLRRSVSTVQICLLFALASCVSCGGSAGNSSSQISLKALLPQIAVSQYVFLNGAVPGNANATVNWTVNGIPNGNSTVGTIVSFSTNSPTNALAARYLAPAVVPNPATVTITVMLQSNTADQANATITVGPSITISPAAALVPPYGYQQFAVATSGVPNTAVTWQISCATGGSACGAISQSGFYKAPNSVPTIAHNGSVVTQPVTLTATSQAAPLFSANAGIIVVPPNQMAQAQPILLGTSGSNAGDSCGGATCGGGTFGSLLERDGIQYILTNWHVAAATDGGIIGDAFVQPGLLDTACSLQQTTTVANLTQLLNPQTQTGDRVDAAIAQIVGGAVDPTGAILELGSSVVNGVPQSGSPVAGSGTAADVGELVAKSGRSTGLTCGAVQSVDASINITYTNECATTTYTVSFSNQVVVAGTGFTAEGDSGSLIVDQSTAEPVALLFASDSDTTIGNPVSDVLAALKDSNGNVPVFVGSAEHPVGACSIPAPSASPKPAARISLADMQLAIAIKEKHVSS